MQNPERLPLATELDLKAFQDLVFHSIPPEHLVNEAGKFLRPATQLVFEVYTAGRNDNTRIVGQQLYATIRETSKYAYQNDWHRARGTHPFAVRFKPDSEGYIVKGGIGGNYRLEDVELFFDVEGEMMPLTLTC